MVSFTPGSKLVLASPAYTDTMDDNFVHDCEIMHWLTAFLTQIQLCLVGSDLFPQLQHTTAICWWNGPKPTKHILFVQDQFRSTNPRESAVHGYTNSWDLFLQAKPHAAAQRPAAAHRWRMWADVFRASRRAHHNFSFFRSKPMDVSTNFHGRKLEVDVLPWKQMKAVLRPRKLVDTYLWGSRWKLPLSVYVEISIASINCSFYDQIRWKLQRASVRPYILPSTSTSFINFQ